MSSVIILGTGLAGYNLAKEFRKLDKESTLKIITSDDGRNYSKPMLSTGFSKKKTADELALQDADTMAKQLNAEILTETYVSAINADDKYVELNNGEQHSYGKLVLALGAAPIKLPIEEAAGERMMSVNDLQDYGKFRELLPEQGRIVIIGAGLIGCEFANDLRNGGYPVDVVAMDSQIMPTLIPDQVAGTVQAALEEAGANFHLNRVVKSVTNEGDKLNAILDNGETIQADIILSAIGLRPRTELAANAGLNIGRGVQVDRFLQTSNKDIYALGDCAEVDGLNLQYVLPLMSCARSLAKTLAGEPSEVKYGAMPVNVKTPACPLVVSPPAAGATGQWQINIDQRNVKALFSNGDDLSGYALTGTEVSEKLKLNSRLPALLK